MPVVRAIVRQRRRPTTTGSRRSSIAIVKTPGVPDEERGCAGGDHRRRAAVSTTTANQGSQEHVIHHREAHPRRTMLRGLGATVALPFLDAMVPARGLWSDGERRRRSIARGWCASRWCTAPPAPARGARRQNLWSPAATGRDFDLGPTSLSPLEPFRKYLTIVSDTDVRSAEAVTQPEIGGDHFRSSAVFLTQAHPKQTESSDVRAGISLDQIYAQRFGQDTPIPSMQLCIENVDQAGGCAYGYSCVYTDMISWASPTEPLPMIRDPRMAFDQLFGAGGSDRRARLAAQATTSVLDYITGQVADLNRKLDASDRQRMERYLEDVREIERRIQKVEARNTSGEARELPGAPAGVPDSFDEHVKLMFDLQALAFQADVTRVFSFKMGRDASSRVYPESGVTKGFHPASHHGNKPASITEFAADQQVPRQPAAVLPREAAVDPGRRRDRCSTRALIVYGSPMGDGNVHNHKRCPLVAARRRQRSAARATCTSSAPAGTPMANVMLTRDAQDRARRHARSSAIRPATFSLCVEVDGGPVARSTLQDELDEQRRRLLLDAGCVLTAAVARGGARAPRPRRAQCGRSRSPTRRCAATSRRCGRSLQQRRRRQRRAGRRHDGAALGGRARQRASWRALLLAAGAEPSATTRLGALHAAAHRRRGRSRRRRAAAARRRAPTSRADDRPARRRCTLRRRPAAARPSRRCSTAAPTSNVARAAVGADAADVRGRGRPHRRRCKALLAARRRRARPPARSWTSARATGTDSAESRARNARVAAIQRERAAAAGQAAAAPAAAAGGRAAHRAATDNGNEPEPLGYAELVGAHGGLTALLLAAREGLRRHGDRAARRPAPTSTR